MTNTPSRSAGRWLLFCIVLAGGITAVVVLVSKARGGAIYVDSEMTALKQLAGVYLPLLGIMVGFFVSEWRAGPDVPSVDPPLLALIVTCVITGLWAFTPPALLLMTHYIEDFFSNLEWAKVACEALAAGAVSFYYAK